MKANLRKRTQVTQFGARLALVFSTASILQAAGQGTVFTYQGHLNEGGKPAVGLYDFRFELFPQASGSSAVADAITNTAVSVSNGMFIAMLDFGSAFDGSQRWLEIGVRTNGPDSFSTLAPRQALAATPYAIFAAGARASGITGTISAGNIASGTITANMFAPGAAAANLAAGTTLFSADPNATNLIAAGYARVGGQLDLSWQQRATTSPRSDHTAIWTGSRLVVWGGTLGVGTYLNTGASYDPSRNEWKTINTSNAPVRRTSHTAVWTGTRMIVWGGSYGAGGSGTDYMNSGGNYDPVTDSWAPTALTNAPTSRNMHTVIWTGKEMVVWGGQTYFFPTLTTFNDGGRYDPATDTWGSLTTNGAPSGRYEHTAIWTGTAMLVWGGSFWNGVEVDHLNDGARYNPTTDSWIPISTNGAPAARGGHCAVWTGNEMIIWGGVGAAWNRLTDGARYDPSSDSWLPLPSQGAPNALSRRKAVWTGREMSVWGGDWSEPMQSGASYDPERNVWTAMTTTGGPKPRNGFTATWTGSEMLVFGGMWADTCLGDVLAYSPSRVMYLYSKP
jgi:N-acetylneuraminic acid mutarotase